jgi:hypothetical protein
MNDSQIREIFLANGFTIKEGQTDLKPYVYAAARALLAAADRPSVAEKAHAALANYRHEWKESDRSSHVGWIKTDDRLPDADTPVLLLHYNGTIYEGELRWERPTYEETFQPYQYFIDADENSDWEWSDITHWMPKLETPLDHPSSCTKES